MNTVEYISLLLAQQTRKFEDLNRERNRLNEEAKNISQNILLLAGAIKEVEMHREHLMSHLDDLKKELPPRELPLSNA